MGSEEEKLKSGDNPSLALSCMHFVNAHSEKNEKFSSDDTKGVNIHQWLDRCSKVTTTRPQSACLISPSCVYFTFYALQLLFVYLCNSSQCCQPRESLITIQLPFFLAFNSDSEGKEKERILLVIENRNRNIYD